MKVQSICNSKIFKKGLEFAATNGALFAASASLVFSSVRPLVILSAPANNEDKKLAGTKAVSSSLIGYLMMLGASLPVANAIKNIDKAPEKYLKNTTIKTLQAGENSLKASKKYSFATQLFKLGLGFVIAAPKSILTCALIPPIMKIFNNTNKKQKSDKPSFTGKNIGNFYSAGVEKLSKIFGKAINSDTVLNLSDRFYNTRFEQHIISLTDVFSTAIFINSLNRQKDIKSNRKKTLLYNSAIATGLSVGGGYVIDSLTKQPTEKFVEKFKEVNKNSPKLNTYLEGIRVVKPVLILGTLYYILIPFLSTFLADRVSKDRQKDIKGI